MRPKKKRRKTIGMLLFLSAILFYHTTRWSDIGIDQLVDQHKFILRDFCLLDLNFLESHSNSEISYHLTNAVTNLSPTSVMARSLDCPAYFRAFHQTIFFMPGEGQSSLKYSNTKSPTRLAFSIIAHNQEGLFETLLHLIYRKENLYCIYVGSNADPQTRIAIENIVHCFQEQFNDTNVFMAKNATPIYWASYTLLNADITCMEQLLSKDQDWDYFINLAGKDLPMISVDEMSKRLHRNKVKQLVWFTPAHYHSIWQRRLMYKYFIRNETLLDKVLRTVKGTEYQYAQVASNVPKEPPPFGLTIFKGSKYVILNSESVHNFVHGHVAKSLREWLKDVSMPEEFFFATMSRIDFKDKTGGVQMDMTKVKARMIYGLWPKLVLWSKYPCLGQKIRNVCNLSTLDLPELRQLNTKSITVKNKTKKIQNAFFANKFNLDVDPLAVLCHARYIASISVVNK